MFEQYSQALAEELPHLKLEGQNYPPSYINQLLSNVFFAVRMLLIVLIVGGPGVLQSVGIQQPPAIYMWTQENKMTALILVFLIGGQIEGQLLSTGAFEIYLNGLSQHTCTAFDFSYMDNVNSYFSAQRVISCSHTTRRPYSYMYLQLRELFMSCIYMYMYSVYSTC